MAASVLGQTPENLELTAVGRDPRWKIAGRTASIIDAKGKRAVKVSEGQGMGVVWLEGYDFGNGVIEIDMLERCQPIQGSFVDVAFRVVDAQTLDAVYFRPFSFRAGGPARHNHAVQYVSRPLWPWQKLHSNSPDQYKKAVVPEPGGDEWFHARIVVELPRVSVSVNGANAPCLVVNELSGPAHGSLGLWIGEGSEGCFANLRVTRTLSARPRPRTHLPY